jgi:hypothetical protein
LLINQFVVQEYEDKRTEEAQQQDKNSKGDSSSKAKMRHEPFSFEDGMVYNCSLRVHTAVMFTAVSDVYTWRCSLAHWPVML